ncbi:unnamed protein product [Ixodes hexagonus]
MLNETSKNVFHSAFEKIRNETNRTIQLGTFLRTVFQDYSRRNPTLFQNLTGYNFHASVLQTRIPKKFVHYKSYVNDSDFKIRIHVGSNISIRSQMPYVVYKMGMEDFFTDITDVVQSVFNKYRVLLYGGQLDTIFPAINMEKFYYGLTWNGSEEFNKTAKAPWYSEKDPDLLNGYVTRGGNVTHVLLVRAGHDPGSDVPKPTNLMTASFLANKEFAL